MVKNKKKRRQRIQFKRIFKRFTKYTRVIKKLKKGAVNDIPFTYFHNLKSAIIRQRAKLTAKKIKFFKTNMFKDIIRNSNLLKAKQNKKKVNSAFSRVLYRLYLLQRIPSVIVSHRFSWIEFCIL